MKNWILILVLIALIIIAYVVYKQKAKNSVQIATNANNQAYQWPLNTNTQNTSTSNTSTSGGSTSANNSVVKIGDNVFAGPTGVNLYKTPLASQTNILKYFAPFMKIGTYLATEGDFFKVTTTNPNFGNGFDFTLYVTGYAKITQTTFK